MDSGRVAGENRPLVNPYQHTFSSIQGAFSVVSGYTCGLEQVSCAFHEKGNFVLLKGLGDLAKMGGVLKQAKDMMANMEAMKEKLGEEQIEASAGGGMVTVLMSGKIEVLSVKIDPEIANTDDLEMLETLVRAAVNEASLKAKDMVKEKMAEMTGGLDIPGLT